MCRLLGVLANERTNFRFALREAPRSLATLSREHPHGWGVAVHDDADGWTVEKGVLTAGEDEQFHHVAAGAMGRVLLAHVRYRTVGEIAPHNTHPFQRGRWVFAHNGTIKELDLLHRSASPARRAEVRGTTDSELFFAFLLTHLDAAGVADAPASEVTDAVLARVLAELRARPDFGAFNFLLSDGATMYAHRKGRTLHVLERRPEVDAVRAVRVSHETGAQVETPWDARRRAVLVASEQMTDEPWLEVPEGTLLRVDSAPEVRWSKLAV